MNIFFANGIIHGIAQNSCLGRFPRPPFEFYESKDVLLQKARTANASLEFARASQVDLARKLEIVLTAVEDGAAQSCKPNRAFLRKIPFSELIGKWQAGNPLEKHLPITKNFLSSWDGDNWISDIQEDHSIAR
jgi:hypothetical protein